MLNPQRIVLYNVYNCTMYTYKSLLRAVPQMELSRHANNKNLYGTLEIKERKTILVKDTPSQTS